MATHRTRVGPVLLAAAACLCVIPRPTAAQTSLQIPLQFDFLNPGAKSLALGGAFVALADDATATFANPAGLWQVPASELSFEARYSRARTRFLERGRLSGPVTNEGSDTIAGGVFGDSLGSHFGPGFISAVYIPTTAARPWAVAAYRHELVRVDQEFVSQGVFQKVEDEFTSRRDSPQTGERVVRITAYGASVSFRPDPRLAVGGSLTVYDFHLDSTFRRYATDGFFGAPDFNDEVGRGTQSGDSLGVAPTLGMLWTSGAVRIGAVYRQGASFDFTTVSGQEAPRDSTFRVPSTLAIGAARTWELIDRAREGQPTTARVTVAAELTRVTYSRLRGDFVTDQARASGREESFQLDNGTEFHVGVQLAKPGWSYSPRFRAGIWYDPDHSVKFTPSASSVTALDRLFDERLGAALSTGKNQVHVTGGVGLTFGSHLELNAGLDLASTTRIFSTSLIVK